MVVARTDARARSQAQELKRGEPRSQRPHTSARLKRGAEAYPAVQLVAMVGVFERRLDSLRRSIEVAQNELRDVRSDLAAVTHIAPESGRRLEVSLDTLTPRQKRIALLAADGLSNAEAAAVIGVAADTVKSHLTGVFRKLEVRSRWELAYLLNPGGRAVASAMQATQSRSRRDETQAR